MDIILWRHAEAVEGWPDIDRALTAKGRKQATKVGQWLNACLPTTCRILVSPATRTIQTAEALGREYKIAPELGPEGTAQSIFVAAHWPSNREPVLIVGHQPTLGNVASTLISGIEQNWTIRKGNIWWISLRDNNQYDRRTEKPEYGAYIKIVMSPELIQK